jgi:hypothetical protein
MKNYLGRIGDKFTYDQYSQKNLDKRSSFVFFSIVRNNSETKGLITMGIGRC